MGWDMFSLNWPVFGMLIEKNSMARTTRTLGTLVASGVPILEALNITRETCGNAMFERLFGIDHEALVSDLDPIVDLYAQVGVGRNVGFRAGWSEIRLRRHGEFDVTR